MDLDFTLDTYKQLCMVMKDYEVLTFSDYLLRENLPEKYLILRHDIDKNPRSALAMAEVEAELGIHATYYFRMQNGTFIPEIINKIVTMGHEVGYHYEALDKAKGDCHKAIGIFQDELKEFRKITDVKTICMHGNPLTRWDNLDLWKTYDFKNYCILGEAYLSLREKVYYFSDTGRTWNSKYRVYDQLRDGLTTSSDINTTEDIINFIRGDGVTQVYIQVHPQRWSRGCLEWLRSYLIDWVSNIGKRIVFKLPGYKT